MPPETSKRPLVAQRWKRQALVSAALLTLLGSCMGPSAWHNWKAKQQRERAYAMWQERCKKSGEFIHKTVENVEGVYLVNVRTTTNFGEQFELDDPYGHDSTDERYIQNFLRGYHHQRPRETPPGRDETPRIGYDFVEAFDPTDGKLYRFKGRVDQPWLRDKSYGEWVREFVLDRTAITQRTARYGVKFEDISTHEEREHWIAGSSLKVIDLQTQEVIAERIGYMVDWAQGNRSGRRSPWLFAADNACPSFVPPHLVNQGSYGSQSQAGQTLVFTEKVLKPSHREQ
ncbi:hypothetical protein [Roseateles aquae]|nr:hypothetical protein [Paucibacter sp. APW11]